MKRLLMVIPLSVAVLSAAIASTDTTGMWDFKSDGSAATITRWYGTGTTLEVHETISALVDGNEVSYTVVSLGSRSIREAALEEVTLPSTVTDLEANVFVSTTNITSLVFCGDKPNFGNHWFGEIDLSKVTIYVYMDRFGWADDLAAGVMTQTVITGPDSSETITIPIKNHSEDPAYTISADPLPGLCSSSLQVSLSCDKTVQDGQSIIIFYTTDGTAPTLRSPRYAEPILVTATTTISCFAALYSDDTGHFLASGPIASFTYTFPLANGGPYTEKVSDRTWTFRVFGDKSYLCPPSHATPCADPEPKGALVIPDVLGGHSVAGVDVSAFERCLHLTEVEFPVTVAKVGSFAFKDCLRLTNLVWKGTVPAIDLAAFDGCPLAGTGVTPTEPKTIYIPIEIQPDDTGAVSVPESWLDDMAVLHGDEWKTNYISRFGSDFTNSLMQATGKTDAYGNSLCVWQDYVAGTDPLNASDVLKAQIAMADGEPHVTWLPDLSSATPARVYKVYGMKTLGARLYATDVTSLSPAERKSAGYKFFYVTVRMAGQ